MSELTAPVPVKVAERVDTPAEAAIKNRAYEDKRRRYRVEHPIARVTHEDNGTRSLL